jgi:hypothetical protein
MRFCFAKGTANGTAIHKDQMLLCPVNGILSLSDPFTQVFSPPLSLQKPTHLLRAENVRLALSESPVSSNIGKPFKPHKPL